jgi:hypothetical protein
MIDISKHITMIEATHSNYAIAHNIKNEPDIKVIASMQHVAQTVFEPLRGHFGVPIKINSFYRSPALNRAIGGAMTSQHVTGCAIDLDATGPVTNKMLFDHIRKNLPFDQLIAEGGTDENPDWVHVSLTQGKNRYQILRAKKNSVGKMTYEDITKFV